MKKVYHLSTCDNPSIIKENKLDKKGFEMQDIKTEKITPAQLDEMKKMAGVMKLYLARALKYKSLGLKDSEPGRKGLP